ncbi:uncharacterized protein LOC106639411 [Copidosoma floridanum]|uniref:uncharacterized protein LOC106639411 n=1 Tax=Copidosoma floridanum TaxID=29053 RepID=UPI0006C97367|nr:uncharacterized protein LOC106639411 [Copidosoma floridanum]
MTLTTAENIDVFGTQLQMQEDSQQPHPVYMMLSVQQQQQEPQHYQRPSPTSSSPVVGTNNNQHLRNNVIVEANVKGTVSMAHQPPKKKPYGSQTCGSSHQPASVARRNARERNRVKLVNDGFAKLRQRIPQALAQAMCVNPSNGNNSSSGSSSSSSSSSRGSANNKKLSKVDTLRMALAYIKNLKQVIDEHDSELSGASSVSSNESIIASPMSSQNSPGPSCIDLDHHNLQQSQPHHQPQELLQPVPVPQQQQLPQMQPVGIKFELKSERMDDEFPESFHHHHHHHGLYLQQPGQPQQQSPIYVPTPNSEASSSPTPSFVSDASSTGGSQGYGSGFGGAVYAVGHPDVYDSYEPMSPEDEEQLLGYLTMYPWQQAQ